MTIKIKNIIIIFIFSLILTGPNIFSQQKIGSQASNEFMSASRKNYIDTLAFENVRRIMEQNQGLLEKEIDPDEYILGPYDFLAVSIISSKPEEIEVFVSPEGVVIIPGAGYVNVKGKTLSEGREMIIKQIRKYYKSEDVYVTLSQLRQFKVSISGSIPKPVSVAATAGERVSEIIDRAGGLTYRASIRNIVLIRDGIEQPVDLVKYFFLADQSANPFVLGGDLIRVPPLNIDRTVEVHGEVIFPDIFEFVDGDSLSTLLKFSQGFLPLAVLDSIEFARFAESGNQLIHKVLDLRSWKDKLFSNEPLPGDFPLLAGDRVYIRKQSEWKEPHYAIIEGEVVYPGKYAIIENRDNIYDLIQRAGGFKEDASLESTIFIRQRELEVVDYELERLRLMNSSDMSESEFRYFQARIRERRGIMTINFPMLMDNPSSEDNITLVHMDSIIVPDKKTYINVQGRVNNPGNITYNPIYDYMDYIILAGGFGYRSDENETFITKSKGEQFLAKNRNYTLEPGDVILVPPRRELNFWELFTTSLTVVTQIISIAGITFTIINSAGKE
jgi:protein involved in polysaccharide export with SLBB domain